MAENRMLRIAQLLKIVKTVFKGKNRILRNCSNLVQNHLHFTVHRKRIVRRHGINQLLPMGSQCRGEECDLFLHTLRHSLTATVFAAAVI